MRNYNPVELFEKEFSQWIGSKYAVAVCNGTAALHTGLTALEAKPGNEVITTAYTFPATANAILMTGATPVFADIEQDGFNIDPDSIREKITGKTRGIIAVHLFGEPCRLDEIVDLVHENDLWLIEDCSQSIGAEYKGTKLGRAGDVGTYSFYATKNLPAYEGGMIVTDNPCIKNAAQRIRNHGLDENGNMVMMGYNYKMPWSNAFHGWQYLLLHKPSIIAELGRYGPNDGYYPQVVYNHPYYREIGVTGDCPNAKALAEKVRRNRD